MRRDWIAGSVGLALLLSPGLASGKQPVTTSRHVRVVGARTIAPPTGGGGHFLVSLPDGTLLTDVHRDGQRAYLSRDGGRTWAEPEGGVLPPYPTCLRDGMILAFGHRAKELPKPGEFAYDAWRGKDTYASIRATTCRVIVPQAVAGTGDDMKPGAVKGMVFWSPMIVEMDDGRLLATMYGWFAADTEPVTTPLHLQGAKRAGIAPPRKMRSVLVASTDRGRTWRYVSTVCRKVDPRDGSGRPIPNDGPCEPTMVRAANGDLVVVMRVGRITPLFLTRSRDGGRTWDPPRQLAAYGVAPNMIRMRDGTLACAYGIKEDLRGPRELHVMFSFDHGRSWPVDKLIFKGRDPGTYPGLCEVRPGVLLYSYDPHPASKQPRCVVLVEIRLEPASG